MPWSISSIWEHEKTRESQAHNWLKIGKNCNSGKSDWLLKCLKSIFFDIFCNNNLYTNYSLHFFSIFNPKCAELEWRGRTIQHNGRTVDNSWVVPYNALLSLRYNCHINVEAAASPKASLYLFKYVLKGSDRACVNQQVEGQPRDEVQDYVDMRCVSSGEAFWHMAAF